MKKIILTILFAAIVLFNYAQENNAVKHTAAELFLKAKKQKTAAWICLGAGSALIITGTAIGANKVGNDLVSIFFSDEPEPDHSGETLLLLVGGSAVIASIPLFVASSKNNFKGRLMIANQKTGFGVPKGVAKNITGLTLTISL
jgi:hypothetical protein